MTARKPKQPKPGEWQYTVGDVPNQLTAYERADRGNDIYTRVWDGERIGSRRKLRGPIRDDAGKIIPEEETAARTAAEERQEALGRSAAPVVAATPAGPLSLASGFAKVFAPITGKYPADSEHARDVKRAAETVKAILGDDVLFAEIRHAHYRKVWRTMATAHVQRGEYGLRTTEVACETLASAARWLQQESEIEPGEGEPAHGWKKALRKEWESITGRPIGKRHKPRHADREREALFATVHAALHAPETLRSPVDPRIALAVELGAELRIGQVGARTRRSDVVPSPDGTEPLWKVVVHGKGTKLGEEVVLTPQQRAALRAVLEWGYLADLEAARVAGELDDFHLFPGGRLYAATLPDGRTVMRSKAVAVPRERPKRGRQDGPRRQRMYAGQRPLHRRTLAVMWGALEEAAGVTPMPGRRWYGMRRKQADEAEKLEDVRAAVKNRLGGWDSTETREGYLDQGNEADAVEAAEVRQRIRPRREGGA